MNTIDSLGDAATLKKLVERTITEFTDDALTNIRRYAFAYCQQLESVSLPNFVTADTGIFMYCNNLTSVSIPKCASVPGSMFYSCQILESISLPSVTSIDTYAFGICPMLNAVVLGNTAGVVTLKNTNAFYDSSNAIIYVPDALVDSYKAATNWSTYADRIKPISELPT